MVVRQLRFQHENDEQPEEEGDGETNNEPSTDNKEEAEGDKKEKDGNEPDIKNISPQHRRSINVVGSKKSEFRCLK